MHLEIAIVIYMLLPSVMITMRIRNAKETIGRVVGGHEAIPHYQPYIVSLQWKILIIRGHFCGGTILRRSWILTAAHCLTQHWFIKWSPIVAVAGAHDNTDSKAISISISESIVHPNFEGTVSAHDIAILKTASPFDWTDEIHPAFLPKSFEIGSDALQFSGWGSLSTPYFHNSTKKLQEIVVTYIPYDECVNYIKNIYHGEMKLQKDVHICTGPITGGVSICTGDSGGPLIQYVKTNKYYGDFSDTYRYRKSNLERLHVKTHQRNRKMLNKYKKRAHRKGRNKMETSFGVELPVVIGVASWYVKPCGTKGAPSIFTNVTNYLDFIYKYIDQ